MNYHSSVGLNIFQFSHDWIVQRLHMDIENEQDMVWLRPAIRYNSLCVPVPVSNKELLDF
jgi:hypothetical protein